MEFPHLQDTNFPYLNNVNTYAFKNTFDYSRWNEDTIVRLVNVLWDSTYDDVVAFESNDARDSWFDSIVDSYAIKLESAARIIPEGFVKLPLPYDVAARYNYLYIEVPIATSAENMIDYETNYGVRRWYFFIDAIEYGSQNSTHLFLTPDVWINFSNDVYIRYMMLERGHAPVAFSDVDDYLENPLQNNEYLLAPDVDFGKGSVVRNSEFLPIGNGKKYVCFASTCLPSQTSTLGQVSGDGSGSWTPPAYSDESTRYGRQLIVNGYTFGDGYDYSSLVTQAGNGSYDTIFNNITVYCIESSACVGDNGFLNVCREICPSFLNTIVACFVVDENMILFGGVYNVAGFDLRVAKSDNSGLMQFDLTKDMFDFPERYERFAKLYTFPYSRIQLTDNAGNTKEVKIEDISTLGFKTFSSIAFPFLNVRAIFYGIGGDSSEEYTWKRINGSTVTLSIDDSDWADYTFDWDIPTFALYIDGQTRYFMNNYNSIQNARIDGITGYQTAQRVTNTEYPNVVDATNTAYTNADNVATNITNINDNTTTNADLNRDASIACANLIRDYTNDTSERKYIEDNAVMTLQQDSINRINAISTVAQSTTSVATTANLTSANQQVGGINGAVSMASTGAGMGATGGAAGAAAGAAGGLLIGGYIGEYTASVVGGAQNANAMMAAQCDINVMQATNTENTNRTNYAKDANITHWGLDSSFRNNQTAANNDLLDTQVDNNIDMMDANAALNANLTRTNAANTRNVSQDNALYNRNTATRNAKQILEANQDKARNRYKDSRNEQPTPIGSYSGDFAPDYMECRGIQVKIRTESDSAIAQAGDVFARYGYALNRMWDINESGLCPMKEFCYWKASDIWVDDMESSTNDVNKRLERIFTSGVTVWKDPDKIGRISIYDNFNTEV